MVRYSSKDEAAKAQKSLHMCVSDNNWRSELVWRRSSSLFFVVVVVFIQVRAREHNHPGRVCRGGGGKPLLCTRPVARRHDQLAGYSRHQSDEDGRGRLWSVPPDRPLIPLEQQQQRRQRRRRRSKDGRGAAVGRRAAVLQPVEAPELGGGPGDGQPHSNQHAAARGPAERRVHVGRANLTSTHVEEQQPLKSLWR